MSVGSVRRIDQSPVSRWILWSNRFCRSRAGVFRIDLMISAIDCLTTFLVSSDTFCPSKTGSCNYPIHYTTSLPVALERQVIIFRQEKAVRVGRLLSIVIGVLVKSFLQQSEIVWGVNSESSQSGQTRLPPCFRDRHRPVKEIEKVSPIPIYSGDRVFLH